MALPRLAYQPEKREEIAFFLQSDFSALFLFSDLTGLRNFEARNLAVGHILDEKGEIRRIVALRKTKGGVERRMHVTDSVRAIFLERLATYGGVWGPPDCAVFRALRYCKIELEKAPGTLAAERQRAAHEDVVKPHRGKRKAFGKSSSQAQKRTPPLGIDYRTYHYALCKALEKAGLDSDLYGSHSCRKAFVNRLDKAGVPLHKIKDLTGHADLSTLVDCYIQRTEGEEAMDLLNEAERQERARVAAKFAATPPKPPMVRSAGEILGKEEAPEKPVEPPKAFDAGVESY